MPTSPIWPNGAKFALFLSHDIDQIHDRELFHVLATVNHIRRVVTAGETGNIGLALRRLGRILLSPKPPEQDFRTILEIEARHGFRSTFFVLHDPYWCRQGPRYRLTSKALRRIVAMIREAGGEIGLHGGYYRFNDADGYRESREALRRELGVEAVGIRNHLLRFSHPETWQAQEAAGFRYDATFGHADRPGAREGRMRPFFAAEYGGGERTSNIQHSTSNIEQFECRTGNLSGVVPSTRATYDTQCLRLGRRRIPACSSLATATGADKNVYATFPPTHRFTDSPITDNRLLVLPLTVMDVTLFRNLGLTGEAALAAAWDAIEPVIAAGGLVSLLWHNNYFNEPEYADWQWVYEELLERLSALNPWCATGAEIAAWERER